MTLPLVFNIQRFCLHDGDGIRTTFFFKGCPLRCKWCHNPESQQSHQQAIFHAEKCLGCAACRGNCPYGAKEIYGKYYPPEELIHIALRDAAFYQSSGGGVTLSGGEVMALPQAYLLALVQGLKQKGLNIAIDTCGHAPFESFESILPYVDTFLYDIKCIDSARHRQYTGQGNELILSNLKQLSALGANIDIRIPVIEGINSTDDEIDGIIQFISHNVQGAKIRLLPYHNLGQSKYEGLGMTADSGFSAPSQSRLRQITAKFKQSGLSCEEPT